MACAIGFANGVGIVYLGISPIVMTLAMNGILQGAALLYSQGTPAGFSAPILRWFMTGRIGFFTPAGFIEELQRGELVHVPLAEPEMSRSEIGLLIHRERQSWPAVRAVTKALVAEMEAADRQIAAL